MQFHISRQDQYLVLSFIGLGWFFTTHEWLGWLNTLNPVSGLIVYYVVLFASLMLLSKSGLIIHNIKISTSKQVIGLLMVTFAFFAIVNFSSAYTQYVATGGFSGASGIFFQDEDGSLFYAWSQIIPAIPANVELLRWLALIISPALIAFGGVAMIRGKVRL